MIGIINLIYCGTLAYIYFFKPYGPVFDEEGKVVGVNDGIGTWDLVMVVLFNIGHYACSQQLVKGVSMGVKPQFWLDAFGLNILINLLYCFWSGALKIYWIVPAYGVYKLVSFVGPFCCPRFFGGGSHIEEEPEPQKSKTQLKKEK